MKKVMYFFSFLAFMTTAQLNAQTANHAVCPPNCCMLNCDLSQCTPTKMQNCKPASAVKASAETTTPKAINASLETAPAATKSTTGCCAAASSTSFIASLFNTPAPENACNKVAAKPVNVACQPVEKAACLPAKTVANTKLACGQKAE